MTMEEQWRGAVCRLAGAASITDPSSYAVFSAPISDSPIDCYQKTLHELLTAATDTYLSAHPVVGPLFLGGVVAAVEEFFRALLGGIISICPDSQCESALRSINLGSVMWHRDGVVSRGAFEDYSFAGKSNIEKAIKNFIGYSLTKKNRCWGVLDDFDRICEIRHGVVHSGSTFPGKNAVKLGLSGLGGNPKLNIGYPEIQECAAVCSALVVSVNLDLFAVISERWATSWREFPSWQDGKSNKRFKKIWSLFYSDFDSNKGLISSPMSEVKCRNRILKEFSV